MMSIEDLNYKLSLLCSEDPYNADDKTSFEIYELARYLYEQTGNANYLEIAYSTGYLTDHAYLLHEYLKAVENGHEEFTSNIAEIYLNGKLGYVDYEKAYEYYSRAAETGPVGDGSFENSEKYVATDAKWHLACMLRDGLFVDEKNGRYDELLKDLYQIYKDEKWYENAHPTAYLEIADMLMKEDRYDEGLKMIIKAGRDMCMWIRYLNTNIKELAMVNEVLYKYFPLDYTELRPEDITELVKGPGEIRFRYGDSVHEIEVIKDMGENVLFYEGKYYKDVEELIKKAFINGEPFNSVLFETDNWEVIK